MPERITSLSCLLLAALTTMAETVAVEGLTTNRMSFRGTVSGVGDGVLVLNQSGHQNSLQIGIPLESVRQLRLSGEPLEDAAFMEQMETVLPLLPLWEPLVIARLCAALESSAEAGDWQQSYRWSRRLLDILPDSPARGRLHLMQAWSLLEMGLRRQAGECLGELLAGVDPLEAGPRLCWLASRMAMETGNLEEARSWALLPGLQIPAASGPIVAELSILLQEIESQH